MEDTSIIDGVEVWQARSPMAKIPCQPLILHFVIGTHASEIDSGPRARLLAGDPATTEGPGSPQRPRRPPAMGIRSCIDCTGGQAALLSWVPRADPAALS